MLWYNSTTGKTVYWLMDAIVQRISGHFTNPPARLVVWHMDLAGNRTLGVFTDPSGPAEPLAWTIVGPR